MPAIPLTKVETAGSEVQGQSGLQTQSEGSLCYIKIWIKKSNKIKFNLILVSY